jgi:very-short-patch-repair endonuclease
LKPARRKKPRQTGGKSKLEALLAALLRHVGIDDFVQQYKFHPTRNWKADFAWPEQKIIAEVHGGTWIGGRHVRGEGFKKDREKMNEAQLLGWLVLEFTGDEVKNASAVNVIARAVDYREAS